MNDNPLRIHSCGVMHYGYQLANGSTVSAAAVMGYDTGYRLYRKWNGVGAAEKVQQTLNKLSDGKYVSDHHLRTEWGIYSWAGWEDAQIIDRAARSSTSTNRKRTASPNKSSASASLGNPNTGALRPSTTAAGAVTRVPSPNRALITSGSSRSSGTMPSSASRHAGSRSGSPSLIDADPVILGPGLENRGLFFACTDGSKVSAAMILGYQAGQTAYVAHYGHPTAKWTLVHGRPEDIRVVPTEGLLQDWRKWAKCGWETAEKGQVI